MPIPFPNPACHAIGYATFRPTPPLSNRRDAVRAAIRRLRSKIDDGAPVHLIKTLRGVGYKIEAS